MGIKETRLHKANEYLKEKGINIDSLSDVHYKKAIEIASGTTFSMLYSSKNGIDKPKK